MKSFLLAVSALSLALFAARATEFSTVSLDPVANATLLDDQPSDGVGGWTDQGAENSLTGFPVGEITMGGIPFRIPEKNDAVVVFQNRYIPNKPAMISIQPKDGKPARQLYFLSTSAYQYEEGQEAARITILFENGESQEETILFGDKTGTWWTPSSKPHAMVPWRGENLLGVPIGIYLASVTLAYPEQSIREIKVTTLRNEGIFILLGITLSDEATPSLVFPSIWKPIDRSHAGWFPFPPTVDTGVESVWALANPSQQAGRQLWAELSSIALALPEKECLSIARTAKLLGYTGLRLPSLEETLAPKAKTISKGIDDEALKKFTILLEAAKREGLAVSVYLGGGRPYGTNDRVSAFRKITPTRQDHIFLDSSARDLLLDTVQNVSTQITTPINASILGDASLLTDNEKILTPPHFAMLQNAWCAWLTARYANDEALFAAWQIPDTSSPVFPGETLRRSRVRLLQVNDRNVEQTRFRQRFADQIAFLEDLNKNWYAGVSEEIRKAFPTLKLSGATWLAPDRSNERIIDFQTRLANPSSLDFSEEVVGSTQLDSGKTPNPRFLNISPFAEDTPFSYRTAFNRIQGVPFTIRENASAWPSESSFARLLTTMALGAQQGWDAIIHRKLHGDHIPPAMHAKDPSLDLLQNPAFLGILPLGRHLFLRGDLATAPQVFCRPLSSAESHRLGKSTSLSESLQPLLFLGAVSSTLDDPTSSEPEIADSAKPFFGENPPQVIESLTGELTLDRKADTLRIKTPRTVAIAGTLASEVASDSVTLSPTNAAQAPYGVLYATSLDSAPLATSQSILLGTVGVCANTGQKMDVSTEPINFFDTVWRLSEIGTAPILMQPIPATATLTGIADGTWLLRPLNLFGQPLDVPPTRLTAAGGKLEVALDPAKYATPLFHLTHESK